MKKLKATFLLKNKIDQQFDLDVLKSLSGTRNVLQYCLRSLKFFANGTTRALFCLDDNWLVKIGLSKVGRDANKLEEKYSQTLNIIPKVSWSNEDGSAMIVQKIQPIDKYNARRLVGLNDKVFLSLVQVICRQESLDTKTFEYWNTFQCLSPYLRIDIAKNLLDNVMSSNNNMLKNFVEDLRQYLRSVENNFQRTIMSSDLCHRIINFGYDKANNKIMIVDSGIDLNSNGESYLKMKNITLQIKNKLAKNGMTSTDIKNARASRLKDRLDKIR